jgi:hypothetical protein
MVVVAADAKAAAVPVELKRSTTGSSLVGAPDPSHRCVAPVGVQSAGSANEYPYSADVNREVTAGADPSADEADGEGAGESVRSAGDADEGVRPHATAPTSATTIAATTRAIDLTALPPQGCPPPDYQSAANNVPDPLEQAAGSARSRSRWSGGRDSTRASRALVAQREDGDEFRR